MEETLTTTLLQLLEKLAEHIGTTVEHLWTVLTVQAWIAPVQGFLWASGLLIMVGVFHCLIKKYQDDKGMVDDGFVAFFRVMRVVVFLVMFIPLSLALYSLAIAFFNPEYYALQRLLSILGQ